MWHTLHLKYSLRVQRYNVMALMRELDPQGIQLWAKRNFVKKRVSSSKPCLACRWLWQIKALWFCIEQLHWWVLGKSAVVEMWSQQQWPRGHCPVLPKLSVRMWNHSNATSHRLWYWKWHDGSNPLCLKVISHWWVCWGYQSFVRLFNGKPKNWKLLVIFPQTEVLLWYAFLYWLFTS